MASPAVLADLARKAPHSPLAKRLFATREAPATSASTLTEVVTYGTPAEDAATPYDDSTPSDKEIGRQQMQHVPKDVIDRLDANEQRQAEMHEQLLQQGRLLNDLLASQARMSTMIAQLKPSSAPSAVQAPAPAQVPAPAPAPALAPAPVITPTLLSYLCLFFFFFLLLSSFPFLSERQAFTTK